MNERLTRSFRAAELAVRGGDGRTVYGLVCPYGVETTVNDGRGEYREVMRPGVFTRSISERGGKIKLLANHNARQFPIGRATSLREDTAGLVGEFRVAATRDGDEALELVRDGVVDGFSVGFTPIRERSRPGGVVERLECALREVSLTAMPAYDGAVVAGVRAAGPPPVVSREVAEARLAIALTRRFR